MPEFMRVSYHSICTFLSTEHEYTQGATAAPPSGPGLSNHAPVRNGKPGGPGLDNPAMDTVNFDDPSHAGVFATDVSMGEHTHARTHAHTHARTQCFATDKSWGRTHARTKRSDP